MSPKSGLFTFPSDAARLREAVSLTTSSLRRGVLRLVYKYYQGVFGSNRLDGLIPGDK